MNRFVARAFAATSVSLAISAAFAADIAGTVTVKQRLTRPSVTASASMYSRGPGVDLAKDVETDPIAAERERVVVYVEGTGRPQDASAPAIPAPVRKSMQQTNRRFDPEIVVVPVGSSVDFPNMDPIFHNVFSFSKPRSFDLGNYPKGDSRTVSFPAPGIVYVNCRLHPNMAGVIVVAPNQWYARAERDGRFILHDLPPGTYTVVAWHKETGIIRKTVQVGEGHDSTVDFLVPIDKADTGADMSNMKMTLR